MLRIVPLGTVKRTTPSRPVVPSCRFLPIGATRTAAPDTGLPFASSTVTTSVMSGPAAAGAVAAG